MQWDIIQLIALCQGLSMQNEHITSRVCQFMDYFQGEYKWFDRLTGIGASKWRDLHRGKTKAVTAEMIDALCRVWPEFALWFVTGSDQSPRGASDPFKYFDWPYGVVGALEWGDRCIYRDDKGHLLPLLGDMGITDKRSTEYEISIADRVLHFSGFVNGKDAEMLAPLLWEKFLKPLRPNEKWNFCEVDLKLWINEHPVSNVTARPVRSRGKKA